MRTLDISLQEKIKQSNLVPFFKLPAVVKLTNLLDTARFDLLTGAYSFQLALFGQKMQQCLTHASVEASELACDELEDGGKYGLGR